MSNKILEALQLAAARGAVVEFLTDSEGCEYVEKGMRAKVLNVTVEQESSKARDQVWKVRLDFGAFEDFNKTFESSSFYGSDGIASKTAREVGCYEPIGWLYINQDDVGAVFKVMEDDFTLKLQAAYQAQGVPAGQTYIQFLESLALAQLSRSEDSTVGAFFGGKT